MSNIEIESLKNTTLKESGKKNPEILFIDNIVQDFAPEIAQLYDLRIDESEELQIKTGQLHENRILGLFLKFNLEGRFKVTTTEIEEEYKKYFKEIARSTISTYLNVLKRESTLNKERDGKVVYYMLYHKPPIGINPFWFTRIFCTFPAYFDRARKFSELYMNAEKYVQYYLDEHGVGDKEVLIRNYKYINGLIILKIFKNRSSKCANCQFCKRELYIGLEELINASIKDRSDLLSEELLMGLIENCSEIPMFNGINIAEADFKNKIIMDILRCAHRYNKDFEFQLMVANRKQNNKVNQKKIQL